jgi:hypothetical protein
MWIAIIGHCHDDEEAKWDFEEAIDQLCGEGNEFDYHYDVNLNIDDETLPEDLMTKPQKLDSDARLKKSLDEIIGYQKRDFLNGMEKIRMTLAVRTDEQLFEKEYEMFQYYCYRVGQYRGPGVRLYTSEGEGLQNMESIKDWLDYAPEKSTYIWFRGVHY